MTGTNFAAPTVTSSFAQVIWEPVVRVETIAYTETITTPIVLKQGTLLIRDTTKPTLPLPYHYRDYVQLSAPASDDVAIVGAVLAEEITLTENAKVVNARVIVQGQLRKSTVVLHGSDRTVNAFDVDYFQRYGIHLLDTDVNFIDDNGAPE